MEPLREIGRMLLVLGGVVMLAGALFYFAGRSGPGRLPFRLGHLPGDIVHRGEHTTFYFPLATSLLISVVLSFLLWLISHLRR